MNINDITEEFVIPETWDGKWKSIFEKQMLLAQKYKDIENMGDLLETIDNNIDTAKGQKWIKDFAWRVTEELAEAFEAEELRHDSNAEIAEQANQHFKEELADALHFLVELTIIAGYDEKIVSEFESHVLFKAEPWDVIYNLGMMCNTLKNKPWKQTQMLTDRPKFEEFLKESWRHMLNLLIVRIGSTTEVYEYYFKKNAVNQFRQRSNY